MAKNSENKNSTDSIIHKLSNWYHIGVIVIAIGTAIGSYMVNTYRLNQVEENYSSLDKRLQVVESVNYELLAKQLQDIQKVDNELADKIDKTNERVDKVLELLITK